MTAGAAKSAVAGGPYLLLKRGLYYRPNGCGYTGIRDEAGRYTAAEAFDHAAPVSGVTAVLLADAPEFSPKCFDDIARKHLEAKLKETREALKPFAVVLGVAGDDTDVPDGASLSTSNVMAGMLFYGDLRRAFSVMEGKAR